MQISREEVENYQKIANSYNDMYMGRIHDIYIQVLNKYLDDNNIQHSIVSKCRFFIKDNSEREYELFIDQESMQLIPQNKENQSWYRICFHAEFEQFPWGVGYFCISGYDKGEMLERYSYLNLSEEQISELREKIDSHIKLMQEKMEYMKSHDNVDDYNLHFYLHKSEEIEFYEFPKVMGYIFSELSN